MSKYIEILNRIKEKSSLDWLTHSQREIFHQLSSRYQTHKVINLYGTEGVGKTFIGWMCHKELNYLYTIDISGVRNTKTVVLDNFQASRSQSRALRPLMQQNCIDRAIVLTRRRIPDDIIHIELSLDEDDVREFCHNMYVYLDIRSWESLGNTNLRSVMVSNIKNAQM